MSSVDERIVEMRFNNKQFEQGVQISIESLDKLNKSLEMKGSDKSLSNLEAGVEKLASKFGVLGEATREVIRKITDGLLDMALQMGKTLAGADAMVDGFKEYELSMNSTRTIMNGTGESLETVTGYLDELNTYADQTIYSFSDMTSSIGKFTNAGVSLKDAVGAIKGISNATADAGQGSQQASMAMYNFAQAISSGSLKLMDWKSIELANIGTKDFKEQLIESGLALGTLTKGLDGVVRNSKGADVTWQNFRNTLDDGWITSEALIKTLNVYSDVNTEIGKRANDSATKITTLTQLIATTKEELGSGWKTSFDYIFGDLNQATSLWTNLSNAIKNFLTPMTDARNEMLKFWNENGGRDAIIEGLTNILKGLSSILKPIGEAFREVFPPMTGEKLVEISEKFRDLTKNFKIGEGTINTIKNGFKGLFTIGKLLITPLGYIGKLIGAIGKAIAPTLEFIIKLIGKLGELISEFKVSEKAGQLIKDVTIELGKAFEFIKEKVIFAKDAVKDFFSNLTTKLKIPSLANIKDSLSDLAKNFGITKVYANESFVAIDDSAGTNLSAATKKLESFSTKVVGVKDRLIEFGTKVKTFLQPAIDKIKDMFKDVSFTDVLGTGTLVGVFVLVKKLTGGVKKIIDGLGDIVNDVSDVLDAARKSLELYQTSLKADILKTIAISVLILAGALWILSTIDGDKLQGGLIGVSVLLGEVVATMIALDKLKIRGAVGAAGSMILISIAILILAKALESLSGFQSWDDTWPAIVAMGALLGGVVAAMALLQKIDSKGMMGTAVTLIVLSFALQKLAKVIDKFGKMDPTELANGVKALGIVLLELMVFVIAVNSLNLETGATLISALAGSILILYFAVSKFGKMDPNELQQGLLSIGKVMRYLYLSIKLMNNTNISGAAGTIIAISVALLIIQKAVKSFGELDFYVLIQGMISIGLLIAGLTASMAVLKSANISGVAGTLIALSVALMLLIIPIRKLGEMGFVALVQGLAGLAGAGLILTNLAAAIAMISKFTGGGLQLLAISLALIGFSAALILLAIPLKMLSTLSWDGIAKGLVAILAPIAAFVVMSLLLAPVGPALLIVAGALAIFGVAILGIGAGIFLLVTAFQALALLGPASAAAIAQSLELLLVGLADALMKALIAMTAGFIQALPVLAEALTLMLLKLLEVIKNVTPALIDTLLFVIDAALMGIVKYLPNILKSLMNVLVIVLKFIVDSLAPLVTIAVDAVWNFLKGIGQMVGETVKTAKEFIGKFVEGIKSGFSNMVQAGKDLISGFIGGIKSMISKVTNAVKNVADSAISGIKSFLGIKSPSRVFAEIGRYADEGLVKGLLQYAGKVENASEKVGDLALSALNDSMDALITDPTMTPTIRPVVDMTNVQNGIGSLFGQRQVIDVGTANRKAASISATDYARQASLLSEPTSTNTTNNESIVINNSYSVRSDNDIRKISQDLRNNLNRYRNAKGVTA